VLNRNSICGPELPWYGRVYVLVEVFRRPGRSITHPKGGSLSSVSTRSILTCLEAHLDHRKRPRPTPDEYPPAPLSNRSPTDSRSSQPYTQDPSDRSFRASGQSYSTESPTDSYRSAGQDRGDYFGDRQVKRQRMMDDTGSAYMRGQLAHSSGQTSLEAAQTYALSQAPGSLSIVPTSNLTVGPYSAPVSGVADYTHRRQYAGSSSNSSLASPIDQLSTRFSNPAPSQYAPTQPLGQYASLSTPRTSLLADTSSYQQGQYGQSAALNPVLSRSSGLGTTSFPSLGSTGQSNSMYGVGLGATASSMGPPSQARSQSNLPLSLPPLSSSFPLTQTSNTLAQGHIERPQQRAQFTLPSQPLGSNDMDRYNLGSRP
jgi:hypothetical protein